LFERFSRVATKWREFDIALVCNDFARCEHRTGREIGAPEGLLKQAGNLDS
jgi:hypothetical protein